MQGIPHSFELYPPRTAKAAANLPAVLQALAATRPEFFSITYGAAGSSTEASFDLLRTVVETTGIEAMAHLTCSEATAAETTAIVHRMLDLGSRRLLALRGDRVDGAPAPGLQSAAELVRLIHHVHAERAHEGRPTPPARIAVAAFVNGHPDARGGTEHLDALREKQDAGAELAITQLFFRADDYAVFLERARDRGITIPIVPGIMPVTSPQRLRRTLELSGEDEPRELAAALEREPTAEGRHEIGVDHAVRLLAALIDAGAPALHLYTFSRAEVVVDVLDRLGATPFDRTARTLETT